MKEIVFIVSLLILTSCSNHLIHGKKQFKHTQKLAFELFEENGNAFVVTSMDSNFSQIWSYSSGVRYRYDMMNGNIIEANEENSNFHEIAIVPNEDNYAGYNPLDCPELHGGLLLILMKFNKNDEEYILNGVNLKCLFVDRPDYLDGFLKQLTSDVDFINLNRLYQ